MKVLFMFHKMKAIEILRKQIKIYKNRIRKKKTTKTKAINIDMESC